MGVYREGRMLHILAAYEYWMAVSRVYARAVSGSESSCILSLCKSKDSVYQHM